MIVALIMILIVVLILHYLFPIIQVTGDSMYPTYIDGEILIGTRLYKLEAGDVILYKSPTEKKRIVIKRIDHFLSVGDDLYIYCLGDNADNSYDSRAYGYVSSKDIVCKVIDQRRNENYESLCDEERRNS